MSHHFEQTGTEHRHAAWAGLWQDMLKNRAPHLEDALTTALTRRRSHDTLRRLTTNHPSAIDFSSNDFLSLATSEELRARFLQELAHRDGDDRLGSGGSRLLDGNSRYAEQLERDIAVFHKAETGLLCNSGFDANVAIFSTIPQPGDVIVYDEFIHASVHDGMRLSRASKCVCFKHNDPSALRSVLEQLILDDTKIQNGERNVFLAVETVYSMDGDLAPLKHIADILDELLPARNGHMIADEAHSTGVFGHQGRGLVNELGMEDQVLIRLHTFGKALSANGAVILCSPLIKQYLLNYARPLIYTTFMSYPALAAIRASYTYLFEGKTEQLAQHVRHLSKALHDRLIALQHTLSLSPETQHLLQVPQDCPRSPIFAVQSSQPKALATRCQARGFIVRGIVPPTVPAGTERLRICLHASNTEEQLEKLVQTMHDWVVSKLDSRRLVHVQRARL